MLDLCKAPICQQTPRRVVVPGSTGTRHRRRTASLMREMSQSANRIADANTAAVGERTALGAAGAEPRGRVQRQRGVGAGRVVPAVVERVARTARCRRRSASCRPSTPPARCRSVEVTTAAPVVPDADAPVRNTSPFTAGVVGRVQGRGRAVADDRALDGAERAVAAPHRTSRARAGLSDEMSATSIENPNGSPRHQVVEHLRPSRRRRCCGRCRRGR